MASSCDIQHGLGRDEDCPYWYAVYTAPRHEKSAVRHLDNRGLEHYLPLYSTVRRWNGRRAQVELPLFPGYLFARIRRGERLNLLTAPGVLRLVEFNGQPAPIPDDQVERLRVALRQRKAQPIPYLGAGNRVRFHQGVFAGLEGRVVRLKGEFRVVVSIDLIQRSISVEVGPEDLEVLRLPRA